MTKDLVMEGTIRSITEIDRRKADLDQETCRIHIQNTDGQKVVLTGPRSWASGFNPEEYVAVSIKRNNKTLETEEE